MEILTNGKKNNHFSCLKKMAVKADTLIIVFPFVTDVHYSQESGHVF